MSSAFSCSRLVNRLSLCASTALLLGACLDHPLKAVEFDKTTEGENTVAIAINKDVDILFVIDNSGSMGEEQALLSANFKSFIEVLEAKDVQANYRIGITTVDSGNPRCKGTTPEGGNLVLSSCLDRLDQNEFKFGDADFGYACSDYCKKRDADLEVRPSAIGSDDSMEPRRWIERIETESNIGGVASNVEAFQCYGPQGVAGCGFESHLESMYRSLALASDKDSKNYGFLRDAAILTIVVITDEADCSHVPKYDEIFKTNMVFWDPGDVVALSSVCWRAGVACTGGPGTYTECHSQDHDVTGAPTDDPSKAVLQPLSKYIDFVKGIEAQKKMFDENQKVLISLIAGVPKGYENFDAGSQIPYEDSTDPDLQNSFGIGPGCVLNGGTAVPPVRAREFAEAFLDDTTKERNLYSICQEDYSGALKSIADQIRDQIKPACMPSCVRDKDLATEVVEPSCALYEENVALGTKNEIARCTEVNAEWTAPAGKTVCFAALIDQDGTQTPSKIDDMAPECVEKGLNLEFILVRSAAAPAGTTISAACELSENKNRDCPNL